MYTEIMTFITNNFEYLCIPIGMSLRYLGTFIEGRRHEHSGKKNDELITKTYEHMLELYERSDDALEERAQILAKNTILRKEIKKLKSHSAALTTENTALKQQIKDLEVRLKP